MKRETERERERGREGGASAPFPCRVSGVLVRSSQTQSHPKLV